MMLIIFLGLIATLASVSGDCDVGTRGVKYVNFPKTVGTWYVLLHNPNAYEDNFECVSATYGERVGNSATIALKAFDKSANSSVTLYGNSTNWTNNTADEIFQQPTIWSGRYYVVAVKYNSYVILKLCSFQDNQLYVYVAYRSQTPNKATLKLAMKALRKNDIDVKQLVDWPADQCQ